jgi:hypothetical protein
VKVAAVPSLRVQTEAPVGVNTSTVPEPTEAKTSPLTKGEVHGAAAAEVTEAESATPPNMLVRPAVSMILLLKIPIVASPEFENRLSERIRTRVFQL